jgi:hypothetical protein
MAAELAKRILRGELFKIVHAGQGAADLVTLARSSPGGETWLAALEDADARAIIGAIGGLACHPKHESPLEIASREAARAMVEQKLTDQMICELKRLERIGIALAVVGLAIAIPGGVIAAIQISGLFQ